AKPGAAHDADGGGWTAGFAGGSVGGAAGGVLGRPGTGAAGGGDVWLDVRRDYDRNSDSAVYGAIQERRAKDFGIVARRERGGAVVCIIGTIFAGDEVPTAGVAASAGGRGDGLGGR
ncbi:hypothetical protein WDZ92_25320, partial [Nostoc sp. NIES-2111]